MGLWTRLRSGWWRQFSALCSLCSWRRWHIRHQTLKRRKATATYSRISCCRAYALSAVLLKVSQYLCKHGTSISGCVRNILIKKNFGERKLKHQEDWDRLRYKATVTRACCKSLKVTKKKLILSWVSLYNSCFCVFLRENYCRGSLIRHFWDIHLAY